MSSTTHPRADEFTEPDPADGARQAAPVGTWHEPLGRHVPITGILLLVLGAVLQTVDTWLLKQTMDLLLDDTETMSLIIATAIGLGSFTAAVGTGIAIRARHGHWIVVGLLSWAALGGTVAYIRWNMSTITYDVLNKPKGNHVLGALMLALFVAAGVMVMYDMQKLYNRARGQVRAAERRITRYHRRLAKLEPLWNRLRREVALRRLREEATDYQYLAHKDDNKRFAAELRELARLEILRQVGDESESGLVNTPHRIPAQQPSDPKPA